MLLSAGVNLYVSSRLMAVARRPSRSRLESDACTYAPMSTPQRGRGWASPDLVHRITMLDSLIALGVAVIILWAAFGLIRRVV